MRPSGVELAAAFADGVAVPGRRRRRPRPRLHRPPVLRRRLARRSPGAMFTASHNPAQYNGVKFCLSGAQPVGEDTGLGADQGAGRRRARRPRPTSGDRSDRARPPRRLRRPRPVVRRRRSVFEPLKVVADTANGMGGLVVPAVFERAAVRPRGHVRRARRHVPEPPGRPDPAGEPARPAGSGASRSAPTSAWRSTATPTACSWSTSEGEGLSGSTTTAIVAAAILRRAARARRSLHNLICSKAVPEVDRASTAASRSAPGSATRSSSSVMAETGAVVRRRALGALLLPGQLPGRLRPHRRACACSSSCA